jgi:hypothetical protein
MHQYHQQIVATGRRLNKVYIVYSAELPDLDDSDPACESEVWACLLFFADVEEVLGFFA